MGNYGTVIYGGLTFLTFGDGIVSTLKLKALVWDAATATFTAILDEGDTVTLTPLP